MATAVTGLTWNVGALFLYALRDFGLAEPPLLAAAAYSALGLLPSLCRPLTPSRQIAFNVMALAR